MDELDTTRPPVEVRRSRRRTKTVQAAYEDGRIVVSIPARMSAAEEKQWVDRMVERLERGQRRRRPSDTELMTRARQLSDQYLDGSARPNSVSWVSNQRKRWGSCSPDTATIRISDQVRGMPGWVLDYVLLHELAHLLAAGHGPDFQALTDRYPNKARARGFLEGVSYAGQQGATETPPPVSPGASVPSATHGRSSPPSAGDTSECG